MQFAGLEVLCNLTLCASVLERFAEGRAETELQLLGAFCRHERRGAVAASGALAMLSECSEVAERIAACRQCVEGLEHLLDQRARRAFSRLFSKISMEFEGFHGFNML